MRVIMVTFGLIIAVIGVVFPLSDGSSATRTDQNKSSNQTIIVTHKPDKVRQAAKARGLEEVRTATLPNGRTLITYDSPITHGSIQSVIQKDPDFIAYKNFKYKTAATANDPRFQDGSQWNLSITSTPQAWDHTTGEPNVAIAVVDSGVLSDQWWEGSSECPSEGTCLQPDIPSEKIWQNSGEAGLTTEEGSAPNCTSRGLALDKSCNNIDDDNNGYIDDYSGWDFMGGFRGSSAVACPNFSNSDVYESPDGTYVFEDNDPQPYSCDDPGDFNRLNKMDTTAHSVSHGTSVASIAAASTNNGTQIAGINWSSKIMNLRALDGYGAGYSDTIAAAIEYAVAAEAKVINLSLATVGLDDSCNVPSDSLIEAALRKAYEANITVIAASGNSGDIDNLPIVCYPARSQYAIAVGATTNSDTRASFSSYGPEISLVAPGYNVSALLAPAVSNSEAMYAQVSGTSFSAPHVAGLASLVLSKNPLLTPDQVKILVSLQADKVNGMNGSNRTDEYGYGRMNAYETLGQTPSYVSLAEPREMFLRDVTKKTDFIYGKKVGTSLGAGRIIWFETKTLLHGKWYLRSEYDSEHNYHRGFLYSELKTLPGYIPLDKPRKMKLAVTTKKTNLLTLSKVGVEFEKGAIIKFTTKTYINGKTYLRSEYDTDRDSHLGFPYSSLGSTK